MQILSHKIRLKPTDEQVIYFRRACGVKRFAYNWALDESKRHYDETGKSLSGYDLCKRLNAVKRKNFPWMYEVTKWAPQKACYQFADAMSNFFAKRAKFPRLKKRGRCRESFFFSFPSVDNKQIKVPNLGAVKMTQSVRFPGRLLSATISETANRWFASIQVELSDAYIYSHICETQAVCGVDLGVIDLAVLDNGIRYIAPRSYRKKEKKIKRLQRQLSRKRKGGKNRAKARRRLSVQNWRVANVRRDFAHKLTTRLVRDYRIIGIEDLSVSGMLKNGRLSKSIQDAGFFDVRRQLNYKSKLSGSILVVADRFYPSTKKCSLCGKIAELSLSDRTWTCNSCCVVHDRDVNAAINLKKLAVRQTDSLNACGVESSGLDGN